MSEFYECVCAERKIEVNPRVAEVLEETTTTADVTLKLAGNDGGRRLRRLSSDDVLVLSRCLRNRRVTGLDVSCNDITDEGVAHLADLLQEPNSALRSLDLTLNDVLTHGAEILSRSLQCNSTLLALRLSGNKIGDRGAMHLAGMLQVNTTLQELELADCDLATQSVMAFTIALKSNRALRSLDISRPLLFSHQEEWAVHCAEMLAANGGLVELHLGKAGLSDGGLEKLSEGLRRNRRLRHLDLCCNRVTRDGARHLAQVLKQNPTLEVVDLSSNRIEDEGAVHLSEALARPGCSLRELSVLGNNIGTDGLLSLTRAMKTNATLTHIYIWGNHLEEPVCQAVRELMSGGRLLPQHTDVSAYEVDGRVFLAHVSHGLRRRYPREGVSESNPDAGPGSAPPLDSH